MFWDNWIPKKYLVKSTVCAIEICFTNEGANYYYTVLRNRDGKLDLVKSGETDERLELPKEIEKNKIPLVLIINGKGVLLKKIQFNSPEKQNIQEVIRQNLPAINPEEFYIQYYPQQDNAFLSLCRKEQLNTLLNLFKNKKHEVAEVHIGATSVIGLQPLWSSFNNIATSLHLVELSNNQIDSINTLAEEAKTDITVDGITFSSNHTLSFASGLSYFMQRPIYSSNDSSINNIPKAHSENNKFRFLMIAAVSIAFLVAVVNVIFYTSYFDKNNKIDTELSIYQGKYEKINQLLSEYQKNRNLIENAGVLGKNKLSEYADRIGVTLPEEVVLSELYFNPLKVKEESVDSLVVFESKHLTMKGNCEKSMIVNEWINVLKMQKFVKDVSLEKFTYNTDGLQPNFEIKVLTE